jgi:hypothetical protein
MIKDYLLEGASAVTLAPRIAYSGLSVATLELTGQAPDQSFRLKIVASAVPSHEVLEGTVTIHGETKANHDSTPIQTTRF